MNEKKKLGIHNLLKDDLKNVCDFKVLAIDEGLNNWGWAIVKVDIKGNIIYVDSAQEKTATLKIPSRSRIRINKIHEICLKTRKLLKKFSPDIVVVDKPVNMYNSIATLSEIIGVIQAAMAMTQSEAMLVKQTFIQAKKFMFQDIKAQKIDKKMINRFFREKLPDEEISHLSLDQTDALCLAFYIANHPFIKTPTL